MLVVCPIIFVPDFKKFTQIANQRSFRARPFWPCMISVEIQSEEKEAIQNTILWNFDDERQL